MTSNDGFELLWLAQGGSHKVMQVFETLNICFVGREPAKLHRRTFVLRYLPSQARAFARSVLSSRGSGSGSSSDVMLVPEVLSSSRTAVSYFHDNSNLRRGSYVGLTWEVGLAPHPTLRMKSGDYFERDEPLFQAHLARKDAGHARSLAHSCGAKMNVLEVADAHLKQVIDHAGDKGDIAGIYGAVRAESGLQFENK